MSVIGAQNIGQGYQVKVPAVTTSRRSTMQGLVVVGLVVEIWNVDENCVSPTYRSRSQGQGTCQVRTSGKCFMQGLMVV